MLLAPTRYYDPTAVLVEGTYDLGAAVALAVAAVSLVVTSELWFGRRDVN
ncbi:hypothetical protein [Halegenticoccus tardaugens]|nr:hypothetical protein [Halegenticoccus tardaugens]